MDLFFKIQWSVALIYIGLILTTHVYKKTRFTDFNEIFRSIHVLLFRIKLNLIVLGILVIMTLLHPLFTDFNYTDLCCGYLWAYSWFQYYKDAYLSTKLLISYIPKE